MYTAQEENNTDVPCNWLVVGVMGERVASGSVWWVKGWLVGRFGGWKGGWWVGVMNERVVSGSV